MMKMVILLLWMMMEELKGGKTKEAIKGLKRIAREHPECVPCHIKQMELSKELEREREFLESAKAGFQETGNPLFLEAIEDYLLSQERPQEVFNLYRELLEGKGENPLLNLLYVRLLLRLEMTEQALEWLESMRDSFGNWPILHYLKGEVEAHLGHTQNALDSMKEFLNLEGFSPFFFRCGSCDGVSPEWKEICPKCGAWNRMSPVVDGIGRWFPSQSPEG
jgi:lipopolysaccharide biosynthesis regulator YciM